MRIWQPLERIVDRIETSSALDAPAEALSGGLRKAIPQGAVEDVLSGTPIGHPLHPAMVTVPIGAWTSSLVFDVIGDDTGGPTADRDRLRERAADGRGRSVRTGCRRTGPSGESASSTPC